MYSSEIEKILKSKGISVGDRIRIEKKDLKIEGILMPRLQIGDKGVLVVKLDNGYNIGIDFSSCKIELLEKRKRKFAKVGKVRLNENLPFVSVLGCGGTIVSKIEYETGAVFPSFSPEEILLSFPEIEKIANLRVKKLFDLFSEDITFEHWKIICKEIKKEIKRSEGIVLMHGTDTMHYTSAALSFMLQNLPKPVVLVGAQRSSDRGSSDNQVNLVCSIITSLSEIAEVLVCMHASPSDDICFVHKGTKVRKMHSSRRDAFRSINCIPYAKVYYREKRIEFLRNDFKRRSNSKLKIKDKINPNVALIYIHPMIKPEFIESLKKYDGIVIAGTGLGHVPTNPFKDKFSKSILPALKSLIDSGVHVVMAPQTIYGRINMDVYSSGRLLKEIGVIGDKADWLPEVAFVKLMWVLGQTKNRKKVRELMLKNIAGEISERILPESFLG